jgi:hypothetical protein
MKLFDENAGGQVLLRLAERDPLGEKLHGAQARFVIMLSCSSDDGKARNGGTHRKRKV